MFFIFTLLLWRSRMQKMSRDELRCDSEENPKWRRQETRKWKYFLSFFSHNVTWFLHLTGSPLVSSAWKVDRRKRRVKLNDSDISGSRELSGVNNKSLRKIRHGKERDNVQEKSIHATRHWEMSRTASILISLCLHPTTKIWASLDARSEVWNWKKLNELPRW